MSIESLFFTKLQFPVITQEVDEDQIPLPKVGVGLPDFPPSFLMYLKKSSIWLCVHSLWIQWLSRIQLAAFLQISPPIIKARGNRIGFMTRSLPVVKILQANNRILTTIIIHIGLKWHFILQFTCLRKRLQNLYTLLCILQGFIQITQKQALRLHLWWALECQWKSLKSTIYNKHLPYKS